MEDDTPLVEPAMEAIGTNLLWAAPGLGFAHPGLYFIDVTDGRLMYLLEAKDITPKLSTGQDFDSLGDYQQNVAAAFPAPSEPEHDIGWAVAKMRDGYKVRRVLWHTGAYLELDPNGPAPDAIRDQAGRYAELAGPNILATDWELALDEG